jgi:hypothetical protein
VEEKRRRGRPRKYRTKEALLKARRRWAQAWRAANPERWKAIQRRADFKRRHRSRKPKVPQTKVQLMPGIVKRRLEKVPA